MQNIDLPVHVSGPLSSVLKLLSAPRLNCTPQDIGLGPDSATGSVDGILDLKFPLLKTLKMKDAAVGVDAHITDLASTKLVDGLDISQGAFELKLDKEGFTLNGDAALSKVPVHIKWNQAFNENSGKPLKEATVTGTVSGPQWAQLGVDALAKTQGSIAINIQMLQKTKQLTTYSGALRYERRRHGGGRSRLEKGGRRSGFCFIHR